MDIFDYWIEDQDGKVFSLQLPFSVGRSPDNVFVVGNDRASRHHALVQSRAAGEFWLTDLNSRNGVFLNRQPIQQSVRLKHLDVFQVADVQFVFHSPAIAAAAMDNDLGQTIVTHRTIDAWILVADIVGSVRQSQAHAPNVWSSKVAAWIADCRSCIEDNEGQVAKFLGDGFLSFWTAERSSVDKPVKGMELLRELQARTQLPFRVVVHYGPVQLVSISRGELSLTGDTVNFTFRLEKVASGLGKTFVASRPVIDSAKGQLPWVSLGSHEIPSFPGMTELYWPGEIGKS